MVTTKLGADGRMMVPVELRRQLGLRTGDPLVIRADEDRLIVERREAALRRLQERFAAVPADVSLVDELMEDRRREAERERE